MRLRRVTMSVLCFEVKTRGHPPGRSHGERTGCVGSSITGAHAQEPRSEKGTPWGSLVLLGIVRRGFLRLREARGGRTEAWSNVFRGGAPVLVCSLHALSALRSYCVSTNDLRNQAQMLQIKTTCSLCGWAAGVFSS